MSLHVRRIEHLACEVRATVDPALLGDEVVDHYSIPALDQHGKPERQPASEIQSQKQLLVGGEVLISRLNPRKARVLTAPPLSDRKALASGEFVVLRPTRVDPRFLEYLLLSERTRQDLDGAVQSVTRSHQRIRPEQILKMQVTVPSSAVKQHAIADFLDTETARIDALMTKKRRMIDLLDERKTVAMAAAAGGRLSQTGKFAPSSLAWLDERPSHWPEVLIRLVAKTGSGHTPSRERPDWWQDCTIPWITTGEVAQVRSDEREEIVETREKISRLGLANSAAALHPRGTVVLCRTASAGYSGIMGGEMATSQDFATWTCGRRLRPRFLLLCLRAMRPDLLGRLATGSTHKTIYMPDIHALRVPLPPLDEQDRAVDAAWRTLTPLFTARRRLHQQITLLQEHRQALITAAVTGELEVPGVAA